MHLGMSRTRKLRAAISSFAWSVLRSTYRRSRALPRDDKAQVLILTGFMTFVAAIMAVATITSGQMIYDRIRAQNAVDAAADTFAAFQARGLNAAQHLNDVHYWANWTIFGLEVTDLGVRIACPFASIRPPPVFFDYAFYVNCCNLTKNIAKALDSAQSTIADLILGVQSVINTAFPVLAGLSANALAEANGADKVLEWVGQIAGQMAGLIGMDISGLEDAMTSMSSIPGLGDIYAFPLKPGQLIDLNIEKQDPDPDYLPWDDMGIIDGLITASDIACIAAGSNASGDAPSGGWGWDDDTYYCGGPSYNTWLAGKKRRSVWPALERIPWLNPNMGTEDPEISMYTYQENYAVLDERGNVAAGPDNFRNPAFFSIASSQVGGSPLMERSSHSNFEEFASPNLISVHLGEPGSDSTITSVLIWH